MEGRLSVAGVGGRLMWQNEESEVGYTRVSCKEGVTSFSVIRREKLFTFNWRVLTWA